MPIKDFKYHRKFLKKFGMHIKSLLRQALMNNWSKNLLKQCKRLLYLPKQNIHQQNSGSMTITASLKSKKEQLETWIQTNDSVKQISISPKTNGFGSSVNGGELLLLSLAVCFCNDIY